MNRLNVSGQLMNLCSCGYEVYQAHQHATFPDSLISISQAFFLSQPDEAV